MDDKTLTVERDKVLAAMEKCPTFKAIAETLWPGLADVPHRFKAGDRVTYNNPNGPGIGASGTVRDYDCDHNLVGVEFNGPFSCGHDLGGLSEDGHGWWCYEYRLSPEEKW